MRRAFSETPLLRRLWPAVLAVLCMVLAGPLGFVPLKAVAASLEEVVRGPSVKRLPIVQLSPHVWTIIAPDAFPTPENQGMMANIVFVVTSEGVVVLDTGASVQIGEMALSQLRTVTAKPVIALYNSHYHGDHFLGNQAFTDAFGAGLPIYAHPATIDAIRGREGEGWRVALERWTQQATAGTQVVSPSLPVAHGTVHRYGDVTLKVHHYGKAHTTGDISVEVVEDRVTYVGDVAMDRRIANMDEGSYQGTLKTFDQLVANTSTRLWIPGHGEASSHLLSDYGELFRGIYESARQAVKEGKTPDEAKQIALRDPRVARWAPVTRGWENNIGKYVSLAFLEAEADEF